MAAVGVESQGVKFLRCWLPALLLWGLAWAQEFQSAEAITPVPSLPREVLTRLSGRVAVKLQVQVDEEGETEFTVVEGSGCEEFDACLLERLQTWKWKPARQKGVPVESVLSLKLVFQVK